MPNPSPVNSPPRGRGSRAQRRTLSSTALASPPDLADAARQAVVGFLHDAAAATAERESGRASGADGGQAFVAADGLTATGAEVTIPAADEPIQWSTPADAGPGPSYSTAARAAAAGV